MQDLTSEFLFDIVADIPPGTQLQGPLGTRVIAPIVGGTFEGPRISGKLLAGGADWLTIRADGIMSIDVRATLQATDGSVIYISYGGRIAIPPEFMEKAFNPETVESIDPKSYYFRSNPLFEVGVDTPHAWLNGVVAIGIGRLRRNGVGYQVYGIT